MAGSEPAAGDEPVLVLVVDVANVMGSRPDGWWRDRAGAATRLLDPLVPLAELGRIVAVLEGQARTATVPAQIEATLAPADGDSTIVAVAQAVLAEGDQPLVVTADRGLRARLPVGTRIAGPRWLLDQCSNAL